MITNGMNTEDRQKTSDNEDHSIRYRWLFFLHFTLPPFPPVCASFRFFFCCLHDLSQLRFVLIPQQEEQDSGADAHDHKHDNAGRGRPVVQIAAGEGLVVNIYTGGQRGVVRTAHQEQLRNIEHGQTADQAGHQGEQQDGPDIRKRDLEEGLPFAGAVHFRRLEDLRADTQNAGDQDDHCIAVPHPGLNEDDDILRHILLDQEVDRPSRQMPNPVISRSLTGPIG